MARNLTRAQARAAYEAVCVKYGEPVQPTVTQDGGSWPTGPVLVRNYEGWYSTTAWAVLWEGGPFEWTVQCGYGAADAPAYAPVVFAEPINGYALGLHPL